MLTKIDWQLEIGGSAVDPLYVHVAHTKKATRRWPFYSQNALEAVHGLLRVSPAASGSESSFTPVNCASSLFCLAGL
ncbi:hypothetical protein D16iCDA_01370 [Pseudomonas seleniipraecipitans]|uniref:Uncharacterized protein n=1 Tax=Phytopseudomonas seleniipraecipitans TaxID=640205 RepID=A0ABY5JBP3_9GAMM|nr:hypothetical protein [Pseudomonas seleniipraecipitans]UUD64389.1 hypothetical protein D16iCDA_01370 [Pseudomonas seleniipraecipitans]